MAVSANAIAGRGAAAVGMILLLASAAPAGWAGEVSQLWLCRRLQCRGLRLRTLHQSRLPAQSLRAA